MAEEESIEKIHKKNKSLQKLKDESSITFFLHASLFLFFLTAFTFLLFLYENKYPLILNNEILPEVLFACVGLLIFSFVSLFAFSFWRFLARLFLAAMTGACGAYILGLIYPDNIGVQLAPWLPFLPQSQLAYVADNGNMIAGVAIGFVFFLMLNLFKGGAMAFLSLPVLVALFVLLNTSAKQVSPQIVQRKTLPFANEKADEKTENLIYLILADHTGYKNVTEDWLALFPKKGNPMAEPNSPAFINAFYQTNGFTFYPSAYLRYADKYRNVGHTLNPSLTEITSAIFSRDDASYFVSSEDTRVFLLHNELFKALKDKGYKLNVYQTYPFDFCKGAEDKVEKCVSYPAPMGALYQTNLSVGDRFMLLVGHFLNSSPLGKSALKAVRQKTKMADVPFIGNPLSHSLPIGQAEVLYRLGKDVVDAKGKNVFFAHLNLPHYPYMYDENCNLNPDPMAWRSRRSMYPEKDIEDALKNRRAYMQQLACTYGQINYLLKELKTAGVLDQTKIVIHGDKGDGVRKDEHILKSMTRLQAQTDRIKREQTTVFAVLDPDNKKPAVEKGACDLATLVKQYVLGVKAETCLPPDMLNATDQEKKEAFEWLTTPVADSLLKKENYDSFYTTWLEKGGQSFMAQLAQRQKKADKSIADAGKMMFVAPPLEKEAGAAKSAPKTPAKDTPDFVPVPEEQPEPEEKAEEVKAEADEQDEKKIEKPAEEPTEKAVEKPKEKTAEKPAKKSDKKGPGKKDKAAEQPKEKLAETVKTPAEEMLDDAFADLPQPIALPELDAVFDLDEKWKTLELPAAEPEPVEPEAEPVKALPAPVKPEPAPVLPPESKKQPAEPTEEIPLPMPEEMLDLPAMDFGDLPLSELTVQEQDVKAVEVVTEVQTETPSVDKAAEAKAKLEAEAKAKLEAEAKAKLEAEAKAKLEAEAKAKLEAEAKAKLEAEAKAKLEAEAKAKLEAEAKAKLEAEAKAKLEAEAKAKLEAEAKAKAKEKAEEAEKAAKIEKAIAEAEAKQKEAALAKAKAEAEAKAKQKAKEKKPLPPPENADELDITREIVTERVNEYGETETYIFIERKPNPNRNQKKIKEKELTPDLIRVEPKAVNLNGPEQKTEKLLRPEKPAERELGTKTSADPVPQERVLAD